MHTPRHLLPTSLCRIAEYCGDDTMLLLWEHYGGGHVSIPKQLTPEHHLCQTLGATKAMALSAAFGGEVLGIPRANAARLAARNAAIRTDYANGLTQHQLARRYQLAERQIGSICRLRPIAESINLDLFMGST